MSHFQLFLCHTYEGMSYLCFVFAILSTENRFWVEYAALSDKFRSPYLVGLLLSKFPFSSEKSGGTKVTQVVKLDPANNPHW